MTPHYLDKISRFLFQHNQIMETLPPSEREQVLHCSETRIFQEGDYLFTQGGYPKGAFLVQEGLVRIAHDSSQGHRPVIYVCAPGEWTGYRQIITRQPYPISATALGSVKASFIPADAFEDLLSSQRHFARNVLEAVSYEFSAWVYRFTAFSRYSVRQRLAISLLFMYDRFSKAYPETPGQILVSRLDLADFIGATLETTVRMLSEFKSKGWLQARGKRIILLDLDAIINEVGDI